jgi:hypothetical protein
MTVRLTDDLRSLPATGSIAASVTRPAGLSERCCGFLKRDVSFLDRANREQLRRSGIPDRIPDLLIRTAGRRMRSSGRKLLQVSMPPDPQSQTVRPEHV